MPPASHNIGDNEITISIIHEKWHRIRWTSLPEQFYARPSVLVGSETGILLRRNMYAEHDENHLPLAPI